MSGNAGKPATAAAAARVGRVRLAGRVAAIIPAAGLSRRMGTRDKLLCHMGGEPLIRRAAACALRAGLAPVIVIWGRQEVRAALVGLAVLPVRNPMPERGHASSIRLGLDAVPLDAAGAVVLLPDMPFVTAAMLRATAEPLLDGQCTIVASHYGEHVAPPVAFSRAMFAELATSTDIRPGRRLIARHSGATEWLRWPRWRGVDVDTPQALMQARELVARMQHDCAVSRREPGPLVRTGIVSPFR